ncbi:MAG: hypothetical protein IPM53_01340 [Anaerolineaceae bacterium]|nr:hypothetical protein [Anaerolineaceae bacterium]
MTEQLEQWYALHTKPKAEYKVAHTLTKTGLEVFLPELHTNQNNKIESTPFFPCYLFMAANLNKVSASVWQWTPGLRYIVASGSQPIALPSDVIRLIRVKVQELNTRNANPFTGETGFTPGDSVRIINGPLKDMVAVFDGPSKPSRRVHVLLKMLDYQRRIQLDAADIEKISESTQHTNRRRRRTRGRGRPIAH